MLGVRDYNLISPLSHSSTQDFAFHIVVVPVHTSIHCILVSYYL